MSDCRTRAEAAAAQGDSETFHDLAWRALQKGQPNDPDLMYMLARAQARSGRYGDALVMLGRLADRHVALDAATNADFARLRLLPEWPSLEARLRGEAPAPDAAPAPRARVAPDAAIDFSPPPSLDPFALAHDAVSRRFVIGDRAGARLLVVDELSHNVVTYLTAATAGLYARITALAIDARRGDLWVTSVKVEGGKAAAALHKLQLISGRTLMTAAATGTDASFTAVDVATDGTVYTIDALDGRLFRLRPGSRSLELMTRVSVEHPSALAIAEDGRSAIIAGDRGLTRIDLVSHAARTIASGENLAGFTRLAFHGDAIVGVQRIDNGFAVVRVALDAAAGRATSRSVLATAAEPLVGTLAGDTFYFLSDRHIIQRIRVR